MQNNRHILEKRLTARDDIFVQPESISRAYEVLDLWEDAKRIGIVNRNLTISVRSHAQRTFKLVPLKQER
jgi:hypothetical protein